MEYWLTMSPWPGVILWVILYTSDYYLTIYSARGFRELGYFQFEGSFELTPQYQKDIDALKPFSKLHLILLMAYSIAIYLLFWITRLASFFEWSYALYLGMFLLIEVAIHMRHFRNVFMIRESRKYGGIDGRLTYKRWFTYRNSANELYITGTVFLLVALLTYSLFFLGGAIMCFGTGFKHGMLAKKAKLAQGINQAATAENAK